MVKERMRLREGGSRGRWFRLFLLDLVGRVASVADTI
jgi:hypothetical protein